MEDVTKIGDKKNPFTQEEGKEESDLNSPNQEAVREFEDRVSQIKDVELTYSEKLDVISSLQADILPKLFEEVLRPLPNVDRSVVGARAIIALKDMQSTLSKKHEVSLTDDIDLTSPKIQKAFEWFIDTFIQVLRNHIEQEMIDKVLTDLSEELIGWEDKMQKRLKGLSAKALSNIKNPLLNKGIEKG